MTGLEGVSGERSRAQMRPAGRTFEIVLIGAAAIVGIALLSLRLVFQPFNIPSQSEVPALLVGDYVLVSKLAYGLSKYSFPFGLTNFEGRIMASEPQRGDLAVFKLPKDGKTDFIKRVIGLPGDRIQLIDARLYINGQETQRTPLPPYRMSDNFGRPVDVPHYMETLPNGVSHEIIQRNGDSGYWSNTQVYTVPPGHYFMMGDNRDNSLDSRTLRDVGYVPFENLEGRAEVIFLSLDENASASRSWNWPWSVRWDRIFQRIK
ncbi:MAG: signal peptidase I [Hyphomicrobiales bacterium]|nr:signal peptidase I [Hyphomicrobiales bacterium]